MMINQIFRVLFKVASRKPDLLVEVVAMQRWFLFQTPRMAIKARKILKKLSNV